MKYDKNNIPFVRLTRTVQIGFILITILPVLILVLVGILG